MNFRLPGFEVVKAPVLTGTPADPDDPNSKRVPGALERLAERGRFYGGARWPGVDNDVRMVTLSAIGQLEQMLGRGLLTQTRRYHFNGPIPPAFNLPEPANSVKLYSSDGTEAPNVMARMYEVSVGSLPFPQPETFYVDAVVGWDVQQLPNEIVAVIAKIIAFRFRATGSWDERTCPLPEGTFEPALNWRVRWS